jgi:hypothetical protein
MMKKVKAIVLMMRVILMRVEVSILVRIICEGYS